MSKQTLTIRFFESTDKKHPEQTTRSETFSVEVNTPDTKDLDNDKQNFIQTLINQHARKAAYERVTWAQKNKLSVDCVIEVLPDEPISKKSLSGHALSEDPNDIFNRHTWEELHIPKATATRINTLNTDADNLRTAASIALTSSLFGAIFGGPLLYVFASDTAGNYGLAAMGALLVLSIILALVRPCVSASAIRIERNAREAAPALPNVIISNVSLLASETLVTAQRVGTQVEPSKEP